MTGPVVSLFDLSTVMVAPWRAAGHKATCVDLQAPDWSEQKVSSGTVWGELTHVRADVRDWIAGAMSQSPPPRIIFAFIPCTDTAVSGARHFQSKGLEAIINTLELWRVVVEYCETTGAPYMIENPVSTVSTYWRKPDYTFDPWQYGDLYSKKTCLWTGNGFKMPQPIHMREPEGVDHNYIHHQPPGPERANIRSATPPGFAKAVWEANQ